MVEAADDGGVVRGAEVVLHARARLRAERVGAPAVIQRRHDAREPVVRHLVVGGESLRPFHVRAPPPAEADPRVPAVADRVVPDARLRDVPGEHRRRAAELDGDALHHVVFDDEPRVEGVWVGGEGARVVDIAQLERASREVGEGGGAHRHVLARAADGEGVRRADVREGAALDEEAARAREAHGALRLAVGSDEALARHVAARRRRLPPRGVSEGEPLEAVVRQRVGL
mmetsp:Transcript_1796/g.4518  ORF Transcript_1796/g.4518 Transcript_1796/m.4518 type:complete len:229 (-) Transcript_1796:736-1422(-)|eukprot:CAMPEP_0113259954 /NCGR_PEP_ID=MMETSP0008_2-20120614/16624_1 /TAXON_ID=97485 /ORGANISM="Prymnesium parvum" /LENGTH=228 /DNA_ID=CAMNT_0000108501 /DNA_START=544 /DNA_END=1230 /DNA_ORIENTATION=- /assembly_acc=CAM_ASM_000153